MRLFAFPIGCALFGKGSSAFAGVFGHKDRRNQFGLIVVALVHRPATRFLDDLLGDLHREGAVSDDPRGKRHGTIQRRAFGHFVDEAEFIGPGCVDEVTRQRKFHRDTLGDLIRQHHHAARSRDEASLSLGDTKLGFGRSDDKVARDHQFQTTSKRVTLNRGDQRLGGRRLHDTAKSAALDCRAFTAKKSFEVHA